MTLEDGSKTTGCADCPDVTGTRGVTIRHRNQVHGPGRKPSKPRPEDPLVSLSRLPLAEILELASQASDWEPLFTNLTSQIDAERERHATEIKDLRERAKKAEGRVDKLVKALEKAGIRITIEED